MEELSLGDKYGIGSVVIPVHDLCVPSDALAISGQLMKLDT